MKRPALPKRRSYLTRKTRPKSRKRSAAEQERIYGGETRLKWIQAQGCLVEASDLSDCVGDVANHHVQTGGTGRKADAEFIVPLCHGHHDEAHHGRTTFEWKYGINLREEAAKLEKRWQVWHREHGATQ